MTKKGTTKKTRKRTAKPKPLVEEPLVELAEPEPVEGPVMPLPFGSTEKPRKVDVPADGTLIRMDGAPSVFVMGDGQRRPFANAEAFTACGFGWNEIVVLPPKEIVQIPIGDVVVGPKDLE